MKRTNFSRPPKHQTHPGLAEPSQGFSTVAAAFARPEPFFGNPTRSEGKSRQRCGGYSHGRLRIELCRGRRLVGCERLLNRVAQSLDQNH
jgi:hypothetical protein